MNPTSDLQRQLFLAFPGSGSQLMREGMESPQEALKYSSKIFLKAAYGRAKESFL
jgi:hypothetical protein